MLKVDLRGYHFGFSDTLADQIGLETGQKVEVRYGNKIWTGKVLVIRNLPPGNENKFFFNPAVVSGPVPPDKTGLSLHFISKGVFQLGPVLGILAHMTGKEDRLFGEQTSFLKKLIRIGRTMNMLVYIFSPGDVYWEPGVVCGYTLDGTGEEKIWQQAFYPFPDVIYDRGLFPSGDHRRAAGEFRKKMRSLAAGRYFNPAFFGKWKTHRWFQEHPSLCRHLPETALVEKDADIIKMLEHHPEIYLKPVGGSSGRGILKITRLKEGACFYEGRVGGRLQRSPVLNITEMLAGLRPALSKRKHIAQQGIRLAKYRDRVFDVRALVQKDGAGRWVLTGMAARVARSGAFITNVHAGGKAEKVSTVLREAFSDNGYLQEHVQANLRHLAILACIWIEERTGQKFGEIAVDLAVAADGQVWFIELNAVPGRTVFRRIGATATADRALSRPLEYARFLAGFAGPGPNH
jgi:hypothetical protein